MPSVIDKNRPCKQQPQKMDVLIPLPILYLISTIITEEKERKIKKDKEKGASAISQRKELVPIVTLPLFTRLL